VGLPLANKNRASNRDGDWIKNGRNGVENAEKSLKLLANKGEVGEN
jgi:hypothetical protein